MPMLEVQLNMYHAVALGAAMFWLGTILTRKIGILNRFCIPAPLVGGLFIDFFNAAMIAFNIGLWS
jgi:ESS family glutamate:Na+ symporter